MAQYRSIGDIGDIGGVGGVYRKLCEMLWTAGDRDAAQVAAREGLRISRETGDLALEGWTTRALATIESDEAATDAVLGRESCARRSGARSILRHASGASRRGAR